MPGHIESALRVDFTRVTPWDCFEKTLEPHCSPNDEPAPDKRESINPETEPPATRKANAVIFMLSELFTAPGFFTLDLCRLLQHATLI